MTINLLTLVILDAPGAHETLISLTERIGLWLTMSVLAFVVARPLRTTNGR